MADRYRIEGMLHAGAAAALFLATHVELRVPLVLKILRANGGGDATDRFMTAARALASVHHPCVVHVNDYGTLCDGRPYIVMERLEGSPLADLLEREGAVPWAIAREIALPVCAALHAAHDAGVVHGDLGPHNLFLVDDLNEPDLRVKIVDFGSARFAGRPGPHVGAQHRLVGTPGFMAPEQGTYLGAEPAADIYSVGVLLFFMLTGELPFGGNDTAEVLSRHRYEAPPRPSEIQAGISVAVDRIVLRALAKRPGDRYPSVRALARAIERLGSEQEQPAASQELVLGPEVERPCAELQVWQPSPRLPSVIVNGPSFRPAADADDDEVLERGGALALVDEAAVNDDPGDTFDLGNRNAVRGGADASRSGGRRRRTGGIVALVAVSIAIGLSAVPVGCQILREGRDVQRRTERAALYEGGRIWQVYYEGE